MWAHDLDEKHVPLRNVRGKKTRNPGWEPGNNWVQCDICASIIRSQDAMVTWDDRVVCPDDWEPRHPQDFVRSRYDDMRAKGLVRIESPDVFLPDTVEEEVIPEPPEGSLQATGNTIQSLTENPETDPEMIFNFNSDGTGELDIQVGSFPFQLPQNWFTPTNADAGPAFEMVVTPIINSDAIVKDEEDNTLTSGVEITRVLDTNRVFTFGLVDNVANPGDPTGEITFTGIIRQRSDHDVNTTFTYANMQIIPPS